MFLSKQEKCLVLLYRIEIEKILTLCGKYKSYTKGEEKIKKLKNKIIKLGGNPDTKIEIKSK
jgi:hypothetical protein